MSDTSHWYTIPGTSLRIPVPPKDLLTALVMVFAFLPSVIIATNVLGWRQPTQGAAQKHGKKDAKKQQ